MANPTYSAFSTSGDGVVGGGSNTSWAVARAGTTGDSAAPSSPSNTYLAGYADNNAGSSFTFYMYRGFLAFDLTGFSLPAGAVVLSATLQLYATGTEYHGGGGTTANNSAVLVEGSQASTTTLVTSDFDNIGSTELANRLAYSSQFNSSGYKTFTLNAAGLTAINAAIGGTAKFAVLTGYDFDNTAPTSTGYSGALAYVAEDIGTGRDPILEIQYSTVRTTSDAWAWSDSGGVVSAGGGATTSSSRSGVGDTWAWSDSAVQYRRSTAEVMVTAEGPNTGLAGSFPTTVDLTGATTIDVDSTTGFASSGTAYVIDNSTSNQQQCVFTYTGKTSTSFTGCSVTSLIGSLTFSATAAVGAPNAESHFPQITKLDETSTPVLMCSYQVHGGHSVLRGKLAYKLSTDGGQTWGSEQYVASSPANGSTYGIFGHTMCRMKNGRLVAIWYEHQMDYTTADSIGAFQTMLSYSDNNATSWSTPVKLNVNFGYSNNDGTNGFGSMLYTGAGSNSTYGDLYVPVVGNSDGIQVHGSGVAYRWFSKLYKITDGGTGGTWSLVGTIATTAQTGGYANGEGDLTIAADGTWICHLRVESSPLRRWQCTSTDNGVTWTGHADVLGLINGAALETLPGGSIISTGYGPTGAATSYVSATNGTSWISAPKVEASDATYTEYNGADTEVIINDAAVQVNTAFTYAQERTNQVGAQTKFRWYVDPVVRTGDSWAWTDSVSRTFTQPRTTSDSWAWSDGAVDNRKTTSDAWAWSDVAVGALSAYYSRTTSDAWTWLDSATGTFGTPIARTTSDTWTWSDVAADTYAGPHYYSRTTADTWSWSDSTGNAGTALYWLRAARRRSMSAPTKTYTSVQAKGTARTATWTSPTYKSETEAGILVVLDVTAASGTGGLTLRINAHDLAGSVAVPLNSAPTAVTATGTTSYAVYPFGAISGALTQSTSGYLPRQFSITVTHGDSSSYTYSVGYCLLP